MIFFYGETRKTVEKNDIQVILGIFDMVSLYLNYFNNLQNFRKKKYAKKCLNFLLSQLFRENNFFKYFDDIRL